MTINEEENLHICAILSVAWIHSQIRKFANDTKEEYLQKTPCLATCLWQTKLDNWTLEYIISLSASFNGTDTVFI